MTDIERKVLNEALEQLRETYVTWQRMRLTSDSERELARMKVTVLERLLALAPRLEVKEKQDGEVRMQ